jgi:hypothetical protein
MTATAQANGATRGVVQTALHRRRPFGSNVLAISGEQAVFVKRKIERDLSDKSLIHSKHYGLG